MAGATTTASAQSASAMWSISPSCAGSKSSLRTASPETVWSASGATNCARLAGERAAHAVARRAGDRAPARAPCRPRCRPTPRAGRAGRPSDLRKTQPGREGTGIRPRRQADCARARPRSGSRAAPVSVRPRARAGRARRVERARRSRERRGRGRLGVEPQHRLGARRAPEHEAAVAELEAQAIRASAARTARAVEALRRRRGEAREARASALGQRGERAAAARRAAVAPRERAQRVAGAGRALAASALGEQRPGEDPVLVAREAAPRRSRRSPRRRAPPAPRRAPPRAARSPGRGARRAARGSRPPARRASPSARESARAPRTPRVAATWSTSSASDSLSESTRPSGVDRREAIGVAVGREAEAEPAAARAARAPRRREPPGVGSGASPPKRGSGSPRRSATRDAGTASSGAVEDAGAGAVEGVVHDAQPARGGRRRASSSARQARDGTGPTRSAARGAPGGARTAAGAAARGVRAASRSSAGRLARVGRRTPEPADHLDAEVLGRVVARRHDQAGRAAPRAHRPAQRRASATAPARARRTAAPSAGERRRRLVARRGRRGSACRGPTSTGAPGRSLRAAQAPTAAASARARAKLKLLAEHAAPAAGAEADREPLAVVGHGAGARRAGRAQRGRSFSRRYLATIGRHPGVDVRAELDELLQARRAHVEELLVRHHEERLDARGSGACSSAPSRTRTRSPPSRAARGSATVAPISRAKSTSRPSKCVIRTSARSARATWSISRRSSTLNVPLLRDVGRDGDDELREDRARAVHHVEVTVRHRIEAGREERQLARSACRAHSDASSCRPARGTRASPDVAHHEGLAVAALARAREARERPREDDATRSRAPGSPRARAGRARYRRGAPRRPPPRRTGGSMKISVEPLAFAREAAERRAHVRCAARASTPRASSSARLASRAASAGRARSTNTARGAPRESASMPSAPVPAKRSSTAALAKSPQPREDATRGRGPPSAASPPPCGARSARARAVLRPSPAGPSPPARPMLTQNRVAASLARLLDSAPCRSPKGGARHARSDRTKTLDLAPPARTRAQEKPKPC